MNDDLNQEFYLDLSISCGKRPKDYLKRKEFFKTFSTFKEIDNNEFCVRLSFEDLLKMIFPRKSGHFKELVVA